MDYRRCPILYPGSKHSCDGWKSGLNCCWLVVGTYEWHLPFCECRSTTCRWRGHLATICCNQTICAYPKTWFRSAFAPFTPLCTLFCTSLYPSHHFVPFTSLHTLSTPLHPSYLLISLWSKILGPWWGPRNAICHSVNVHGVVFSQVVGPKNLV